MHNDARPQQHGGRAVVGAKSNSSLRSARADWRRVLAFVTAAVFAATATVTRAANPDLPKTMRAAAIDRAGGPEVLTMHKLALPQVGADDVLIAVHTAGVSVWDADVRQRLLYVSKPHFPLVIGTDGAGLVAAVGAAVTRFKVGDPVYAHCWDNAKGGFYAEYAAVPAKCVARLPKGVSLDSAGALAASGLTALKGIDGVLHVRPGDRLIIHGASGAVGTLAIQFAKLRGALVLATASGDDGVALVRHLGADAAVDGRRVTSRLPRMLSRLKVRMPCSRSLLATGSSAVWRPCIPEVGSRFPMESSQSRSRALGSPLWLTTPSRSLRKLSLRV